MNWKTWAPLAVAIVLGIAAAKMTRDMIAKNRNNSVQTSNLTKVVVAKTDIPPGTELTEEHLTMAEVVADSATDRMFTDLQPLVGRVTEIDMVTGQTILDPMLAAVGSGSGLQALVPIGMRAITIEVNEYSGLAGMLTPGCRVDVVATLRDSGADASVARTIVENVKVSAVGARVSGTSEEQAGQDISKSVTLLTTPEQAEAIELAAATARPRLVLRSGRDNGPANTTGITIAQLVGTGVESETKVQVEPVSIEHDHSDPFASATTQPSVIPAVDPFELPNRRSIQIIRNGVETMVTLDLRQPSTVDIAKSDRETTSEVTRTDLQEIAH